MNNKSIPSGEAVTLSPRATSAGVDKDSEKINKLCFLCCCGNTVDREVSMIIAVSVIVFFSIALTGFPLILLINKRIAGDQEDPNSQSVFVYTTVGFLHHFLNFLSGRYTSGLGDYVGRKPVLISSILIFVLSRIIYLQAETPGAFYVAAAISGSFDCYYFSALAWICDLYPDAEQRSKRVGIYVGLSAGFAFVIGVPLGVVFALRGSVELPFYISIVLSLLCAVCVMFLPVDDTIGVRTDDVFPLTCCSKRCLPSNMKAFMVDHFSLGPGTWALIMEAEHPLDWLTNFLMHSTTGLANLILLQYCLAVFDWSVVEAAIAVLSIGVGLAIFSPLLLHRYKPIPVVFYAMAGFSVGLILLSVSGAGLKDSQVVGAVGVLIFAVCALWVPAMQSMLTSEYSKEVQGAVSGLLSQENDLSLALSYVMSLGFTFSIRRDSDVYWPGSSWAAAAIVAICSVLLHFFVHGSNATNLEIRYEHVPAGEEALRTSKEGDGEDLAVVQPSLELSVFPDPVIPV